jgi:hypothetical protein
MFSIYDFCIAQNLNIGLHHPTSTGKVGWQFCNVPMRRGAIISNTDVICATSCSAKSKDSSMHVFLALIFGQGLIS